MSALIRPFRYFLAVFSFHSAYIFPFFCMVLLNTLFFWWYHKWNFLNLILDFFIVNVGKKYWYLYIVIFLSSLLLLLFWVHYFYQFFFNQFFFFSRIFGAFYLFYFATTHTMWDCRSWQWKPRVLTLPGPPRNSPGFLIFHLSTEMFCFFFLLGLFYVFLLPLSSC